jgi:hypothetical protein
MNFFDERLPVRFWDRATPEPNTGCWLWTGGVYQGTQRGRIVINGEHHIAYRLAYEAAVGPIAEGLTADHKCCTPACVNPSHLQVVSFGDNTALVSIRDDRRRGGKCARGHARSVCAGRVGNCRECERDRKKARDRRSEVVRRQQRRNGRCYECGGELDGALKSCSACRRAHRARYLSKRTAGRVQTDGKKPQEFKP